MVYKKTIYIYFILQCGERTLSCGQHDAKLGSNLRCHHFGNGRGVVALGLESTLACIAMTLGVGNCFFFLSADQCSALPVLEHTCYCTS